ncbi:MAG: queuosine precursor transporter [Clostridia bacterium]|nr:queuosine precursor transporter [Clostridia bacterium]
MNYQVPENPEKNRRNTETLLTVSILLTALYLTANLMAVRVIEVGGISLFDAGTIIFPFTYMLGDALAEIWGFPVARRVILLSTAGLLLMSVFTALGIWLPYPVYQAELVAAYDTVFGFVPRIIFASIAAFVCGELLNAFALVKIKEKTGEKRLWIRTIGSSLLGHGADTVIFVLLAFAGVSPWQDLLSMIGVQYLLKVALEAVTGTPLVYGLIAWLKKR